MELLEKLKKDIDKSLIENFPINDLATLKFVPIYQKDGYICAVTVKEGPKEKISAYIKDKVNIPAKIGTIDENILAELISSLHNNTQNSTVEQENKPKENAPKKRLGEMLIDAGIITEEQLNNALIESKHDKKPLGASLVKLGYVTLNQLKEVLSEQQGLDALKENQLQITDFTVLELIPEDFIKQKKVMPLCTDGKTLDVGMINPNDKKVIEEITYMTGMRINVFLMTFTEYDYCLATYYSEMRKETSDIIQKIEEESEEIEIEESLAQLVEREIEDQGGNVAKFANQIITNAIAKKASDIHMEPREKGYYIRYRIDGILKFELQLPAKVESSVITRFKVLSKMNITEHRRPQDGTFSIKYKGTSYDLRINTLPVGNKEKMVIRILAPAASLSNQGSKELKLVGARPEDVEKIKTMTSMPNGIILATGPTGSGKTTTLYSVLKSVNDEKVNITTIEDPVEIRIEGINQSQTNVKAGITFATCLRAILRQDPDIILVGEIRDFETLEVSISAALTGHLVLSTLHTNSAAAAVTRLIEMGAQSYLVSATLTGVIAQRLVRGLCPHCKEAYHPTLEEAKLIIPDSKDYEEFTKMTIYRPKGCPKCNQEGYVGRLGIYEILPICKEIKKLIARNASAVEIEEVAVGQGMQTLYQSCLNHVLEGRTTVSEFVRVIGPVHD